MASVNLQGLINEVLDMAKTSMRTNQANFQQIRAEDREENLRKRSFERENLGLTQGHELTKQRLVNEGDLSKQRLTNEGQLAVTKETNTGGLARQRLMNIGGKDVAETQAAAERFKSWGTSLDSDYKANKELEGKKYAADKAVEAMQGRTNDPTKVLDEWIKANPGAKQEEILTMRKKLFTQDLSDPIKDIGSFETGTTVTPPSITAPNPVRSVLPDSTTPTVAPSPAITGPVNPSRPTISLPKIDPAEVLQMQNNIRGAEAERKKRADTASQFWTSVGDWGRKKFSMPKQVTIEPTKNRLSY